MKLEKAEIEAGAGNGAASKAPGRPAVRRSCGAITSRSVLPGKGQRTNGCPITRLTSLRSMPRAKRLEVVAAQVALSLALDGGKFHNPLILMIFMQNPEIWT